MGLVWSQLQAGPILDEVITSFLDMMFWEGEPYSEGSALFAAVGYWWPDVSRHGTVPMPHSRQALAGFRKLDPPRARLPLPPPLVAAIAVELCSMGWWRLAVGVMISMFLYLRPGELLHIQLDHLVAPQAMLGQRFWTLSLNLREEGLASKTGAFDDALPFDLPDMQWMNEILASLKRAARPAERLVGVTAVQYNRLFREACQRVGLATSIYRSPTSSVTPERAATWPSSSDLSPR